ncbi:hypothetical protein [Hoeflea sp.]|uniref:hypothetical protein n=1 Tax=Hoeflea sp. TaxID=1940281 RepID=UPI0037483226
MVQTEDIRVFLRDKTTPHHIAVEDRLTYLAPVSTLSGYVLHLVIMRDFYQSLIVSNRDPDIDISWSVTRTKILDSISTDLEKMNGENTGKYRRSTPAILSLENDEAWGARYVVIGSSLGAHLLRKTVIASLGPDIPADYLGYMTNNPDSGWKCFVETLRSQTLDAQSTVNGAIKTFDHLAEIIERHRGEHDTISS